VLLLDFTDLCLDLLHLSWIIVSASVEDFKFLIELVADAAFSPHRRNQ